MVLDPQLLAKIFECVVIELLSIVSRRILGHFSP